MLLVHGAVIGIVTATVGRHEYAAIRENDARRVVLGAEGLRAHVVGQGDDLRGGAIVDGELEDLAAAFAAAIFAAGAARADGVVTIYSADGLHDGTPSWFGNQFDAFANNLHDGWSCLAVRAADKLGNTQVSRVLRVCVDHGLRLAIASSLVMGTALGSCAGSVQAGWYHAT